MEPTAVTPQESSEMAPTCAMLVGSMMIPEPIMLTATRTVSCIRLIFFGVAIIVLSLLRFDQTATFLRTGHGRSVDQLRPFDHTRESGELLLAVLHAADIRSAANSPHRSSRPTSASESR